MKIGLQTCPPPHILPIELLLLPMSKEVSCTVCDSDHAAVPSATGHRRVSPPYISLTPLLNPSSPLPNRTPLSRHEQYALNAFNRTTQSHLHHITNTLTPTNHAQIKEQRKNRLGPSRKVRPLPSETSMATFRIRSSISSIFVFEIFKLERSGNLLSPHNHDLGIGTALREFEIPVRH